MGSKTFPLWNLVAKHCFPYFFIYQIYFTSKTRITIHSGKCMIFPHTPLGLPTSYFAFYFDALFFVADFGPYLKSWSRKSKSTKISELHAATHLNFRIDLLNCVRLTFKTEIGFDLKPCGCPISYSLESPWPFVTKQKTIQPFQYFNQNLWTLSTFWL